MGQEPAPVERTAHEAEPEEPVPVSPDVSEAGEQAAGPKESEAGAKPLPGEGLDEYMDAPGQETAS